MTSWTELLSSVSIPIAVLVVVLGPLFSTAFVSLSILFLLKWLSGKSDCVYGYMECKMRGVPRHAGILNNMVDGVYHLGVRDPMLPVLTATIMVFAMLE